MLVLEQLETEAFMPSNGRCWTVPGLSLGIRGQSTHLFCVLPFLDLAWTVGKDENKNANVFQMKLTHAIIQPTTSFNYQVWRKPAVPRPRSQVAGVPVFFLLSWPVRLKPRWRCCLPQEMKWAQKREQYKRTYACVHWYLRSSFTRFLSLLVSSEAIGILRVRLRDRKPLLKENLSVGLMDLEFGLFSKTCKTDMVGEYREQCTLYTFWLVSSSPYCT